MSVDVGLGFGAGVTGFPPPSGIGVEAGSLLYGQDFRIRTALA